ncbi:MAG: VCBS repeat-containing protein, partial [Caldilineaceae bacterium]|nr:VCBS repeat-containing protein [Caldilineaceae bacterium]
WGDVDGDGDLDLAVGNSGSANKIYLNQNGVLQTASNSPWSSGDSDDTQSVAWGNVDGDGDLDLAVGNSGSANKLYLNGRGGRHLPNNAPTLTISRPITPAITSFYVPPQLIDNLAIPLTYTLSDPEGDMIGGMKAFYSLNGGGQWFPAVATSDTITTSLAASPQGVTHQFVWDTFASGFFGQSDNVVVRMEAYPRSFKTATAISGTYKYTNTVASPIQRPYASATTYPFRVRGTQVRVYTDTVSAVNGVANAIIYQIPANATTGTAIANGGTAYVTDANGYLQGRGQLAVGDRLVALLPVTTTAKYTVYHTSAPPTATGLDAFTMSALGVQELVVSAANPLMLFNLTVSLGWDARKDIGYLTQLEIDLNRASELLYDVTNGQAALGSATVYHDQAHWEDADIRIHATNRLRPHATIGGSVTEVIQKNLPNGANPDVQVAYFPGVVEMPASWNRFGESSGSLGEDWPRALAHEFGHYLFFLLEDYLGFDNAGLPVAVSTCPSLMGNVYLDENSEFHPAESWASGSYDCLATLQNQTMKRSDWETIVEFYPWLHAPTENYANQLGGPSTLPLAVTDINFIDPGGTPTTLDVPSYYLVKPDGSRYLASSSARAFRFHAGNLVDLGEPRQDRLQAWGARTGAGDRVCVFDLGPSAPAVGCLTAQTGITQLPVTPTPDWLPDIVVAPVTTNTLALTVTNVISADLRVQIYAADRPLTDTAPAEIVLGYDAGADAYTATLPIHLAAFLRLWDANTPAHELITDFTLGGAPDLGLGNGFTINLAPGSTYEDENGVVQTVGPEGAVLILGSGTALQLGGGTALVLGSGTTLVLGSGTALVLGSGTALVLGSGTALVLGSGTALVLGSGNALILGSGNALVLGSGTALVLGSGNALVLGAGNALVLGSGNGPVLSSDGQVVLFVDTLDFAPGQFYTLQPATRVPNPPVYATVVGQPYRLAASPGAPAIEGSSLSFRYLGRDVPPGEENFLKVWFYEEGAGTWSPLATTLDTVQNSAAATAQGPGLYVLMSSMEIPLDTAGWNLFAYPVQGSRPITEALASIEGSYSLVYGYDPSQPVLNQWPFHTTDPSVPLEIQSLKQMQFGRGYWIHVSQPITLYLRGAGGGGRGALSVPLPPATFFGRVTGLDGWPGMIVDARMNGILCGRGTTLAIREERFYVVQSVAGCGEGGSAITLSINGIPAQSTLPWDNSHVQRQDLTAWGHFPLFLPAIVR